ncbi:hypothetical protein [Sodalis sp. RH13]|uniref:hypothetical protein n=1 Tax=Sodalis sp. RH13 TaxID=3394328 RepID=UPI0039B3C7A5
MFNSSNKKEADEKKKVDSYRKNIIRIFKIIPALVILPAIAKTNEVDRELGLGSQNVPDDKSFDFIIKKIKNLFIANDSLKYIGQCQSVEELRHVVPNDIGQRIQLASYYASVNISQFSKAGGGEFYAIKDKSLDDDNGTVFRVNEEWCWLRVKAGVCDAEWFGVTGDNIPREENISSAIDYITRVGGILEFPKGMINFGTLRKQIKYFEGIQKFILRGQGKATIFTFENVDPSPQKKSQFGIAEPALIKITGLDTSRYIDSVVIENLCFEYSKQRNQGGADFNNLGVCHPSPYSKGTIALDVSYCLNPIFRNIHFYNIYGNGIYCRRSFNPHCSNLYFYNVSANQLVAQDGSMSKDSSGGAIFLWSCYGGTITNCVAWNTRKYNVDFKTPDTGQQLNGTLCGYIGLWSEFYVGSVGQINQAPPKIEWLKTITKNDDRLSRGIEISNCIVYGYVIGIKGEAEVDISVINNQVLNCYMPISCSGVRGVIQRNFTDMLYCDDIPCPQHGYEQRRSHLGGMSYAVVNPANQNLDISYNYVRTKNYPAFTTSRLNLKFNYNYINILGWANLFNTVTTSGFIGLEIRGNTYIVDEKAKPRKSNLSYNTTAIISSNSFRNMSNADLIIEIEKNKKGINNFIIEKNIFTGKISLRSNAKISISENYFSSHNAAEAPYIEVFANDALISKNIMHLSSLQKQGIIIKGDHISLKGNYFFIEEDDALEKKITECIIDIPDFASYLTASHNIINNNTTNLPLIKANSLAVLRAFSNSSDAESFMINCKNKISGPIIFDCTNIFALGLMLRENLTDEPNSPENLWGKYKCFVGSRLYYVYPKSKGKEGIVMTDDGWKEFGEIK